MNKKIISAAIAITLSTGAQAETYTWDVGVNYSAIQSGFDIGAGTNHLRFELNLPVGFSVKAGLPLNNWRIYVGAGSTGKHLAPAFGVSTLKPISIAYAFTEVQRKVSKKHFATLRIGQDNFTQDTLIWVGYKYKI